MKVVLLIPIILVVVILSAMAILNLPQEGSATAAIIVKDNNIQSKEFKIATIAVCDKYHDKTRCEDKLFYKCGDQISTVESNKVDCDGRSYLITAENLGSINTSNSWVDPRKSGILWEKVESP